MCINGRLCCLTWQGEGAGTLSAFKVRSWAPAFMLASSMLCMEHFSTPKHKYALDVQPVCLNVAARLSPGP